MDLKVGSTFSLEAKTCRVTETYTITWDDDSLSKEFKLKSNKGEIMFLEINTDKKGDTWYSLWTPLKSRDFLFKQKGETIDVGAQRFPKTIDYQGNKFTYTGHHKGICKYGPGSPYNTEKVDSIDYAKASDDEFLSIEVWDDEVEASVGKEIDSSLIRNIHSPSASELAIIKLSSFINKNMGLLVFGSFFALLLTVKNCGYRDGNFYVKGSENDTLVDKSNNRYRSRNTFGYGK